MCTGSDELTPVRFDVQFYEEVRVYMAKFDAADRVAKGEPIPEDIQRLLASLIAESTISGEVLDIYGAAGMPKPSLSDLNPDFITKTQQAPNPHLAIEALRKLVAEECAKVTRNNVVRQRAFSEGPPDVVVGGGEGWQHPYPRGDLVGERVRRQVDEVVSERSE